MSSAFQRHRIPTGRLGLLAVMALCVAVYLQGLFGGFLFDDYPNIVGNPVLNAVDGTLSHWWLAALSSGSGILRRPISMLSFAANIELFGLSPLAFKIVNLAIHLANGYLIYRLALWLCPRLRASDSPQGSERDKALSLLVCGIWLVHPLNVSGVVYIVQRMNLLATLFTLAGLCGYAAARTRMLREAAGLPRALSSLCIFGALAALCKENGALIVLYALVIEVTCFGFRNAASTKSRPLIVFFLLTVVLPVALLAIWLFAHPKWLEGGYAGRNFTLGERLLTEPRILLYYLKWIFLPRPSSLGMYHDDIPLSHGLLSPASTAIAIGFWCAAVALVWASRRRAPALGFGLAWFLVGHAMESSFLPLEIVFEHRNYLPMAGLLFGVIVAIDPILDRAPPRLNTPLAIVAILALAVMTAQRSYAWGDPIRLALITAENHPESSRSLYDAGRALIQKADAGGEVTPAVYAEARTYFERAMTLDPMDVHSVISCILTYGPQGQVPAPLVSELAARLTAARIYFAAPFQMFLKALGDGRVNLPPEDVERLVTAALDNRHANPDNKAMVLSGYGRYRYIILHDAQNAISLTLAATQMSPGNALLQLNLAKLALVLGARKKAEQALVRAQDLDRAGVHKDEIKAITAELAAASGAP